jgi:hypothetical protein
MSQPDADDKIDRAARKHRADRAGKAASDAKEAAGRAASDRGEPARLLRKSLAQRTGFDPLLAIAFVVGIGAPLLVAGSLFGLNNTPVMIGTIVVMLPLIWLTADALQRLTVDWTVRRLRRTNGLDVDHYLGLLSKAWSDARLVVQIRFDKPWPDDQHAATIAATRAAVSSLDTARFEGNRALYLASSSLATKDSVMSHSVVSRFFTNRPVHECFTAILEKVVPVVGAAARIVKIDVDIEGHMATLGTKA